MLGSFVSLADCRDSKTNKFATEKLPCNYELNYSVAAQNAKKWVSMENYHKKPFTNIGLFRLKEILEISQDSDKPTLISAA